MPRWKEDCQPDSMTEFEGSADRVSCHAFGEVELLISFLI